MTTLTADSVLSLSPNATMRAVGDTGVVLMATTGEIYTCNETALDFLGLLDGSSSLGALAVKMTEEYEVEAEVLTADLLEMIGPLADDGVVVPADG